MTIPQEPKNDARDQSHLFHFRQYNKWIMLSGALFFAVLGFATAYNSLQEKNIRASVFFLLTGLGMSALPLRMLTYNSQYYLLKPDSITHHRSKTWEISIQWLDLTQLNMGYGYNQHGSPWTFYVVGKDSRKVVVDGDTPQFGKIVDLAVSHALANGKKQLVDELNEQLKKVIKR